MLERRILVIIDVNDFVQIEKENGGESNEKYNLSEVFD